VVGYSRLAGADEGGNPRTQWQVWPDV